MAVVNATEVYGLLQKNSNVDRKVGVATTGHLVTRPQEPSTSQTSSSSASNSNGAKGSFGDTFAVLVTLGFLSLALYVTFHYFWKKHRKRSIATLYKVDEYRYSRLSQSEMDGDNAVLYGDPNNPIDAPSDDEDHQGKPATLLVEPVISSSNSTTTKPSAGGVQATYFAATSQVEPAKSSSNNKSSATLLLQDSDEDLLQ